MLSRTHLIVSRAAIAAVLVLVSTVASTVGFRSSTARAIPLNPVIAWDVKAQEAIGNRQDEQASAETRSLPMVHGAIYDAVNAIAGKPYQPYLIAPPATGRESTDAAIAAAA